jgi:RES domain-containing protein
MRKIRDPELLDQLQSLHPQPFQATIWRIVRAGRNPLLATNPKGRWDDGSFDVVYAALEPDAARAEVYYHLTRSQPVYPSSLHIHLHEIEVDFQRVIKFNTLADLASFGVDAANFGTTSYAHLQAEYSVTQQVGEAAHFLGMQAIVVPSARWPAQNIVVMTDTNLSHIKDHGPQDLKSWARTNHQ